MICLWPLLLFVFCLALRFLFRLAVGDVFILTVRFGCSARLGVVMRLLFYCILVVGLLPIVSVKGQAHHESPLLLAGSV